jgi:hypothetical protein
MVMTNQFASLYSNSAGRTAMHGHITATTAMGCCA